MVEVDSVSEERLEEIYNNSLGCINKEVGRIKREYKDEDNYQSNSLLVDISDCCEEGAEEFFKSFCSELELYIESSFNLSDSNIKIFVSRFFEYVEYFRKELRDTLSETALVSKQKGQESRFSPAIENKVYKLGEEYKKTIERIVSEKSTFNFLWLLKSRK